MITQICLASVPQALVRLTNLNEGEVADDHGDAVFALVEVPHVGVSGETGGEGHLEVALEAEQSGHHDEQLRDHHEHVPMLATGRNGNEFFRNDSLDRLESQSKFDQNNFHMPS